MKNLLKIMDESLTLRILFAMGATALTVFGGTYVDENYRKPHNSNYENSLRAQAEYKILRDTEFFTRVLGKNQNE